jgi:cyclophilin family peptidyl-prolyl cis-trans isomerase
MKLITGLLMLILIIPTQIIFSGDKVVDKVIIETEYGNIVMVLEEEAAPRHSENFKALVAEGFYDSTSFHRVIAGFMIQGGDPLSKDDNPANDGRGGPGYTLPAEIGLPHLKGSVGAARQGDAVNPQKESNGSQFYICLEAQPHLDRMGYTIFAQVVDGMDVVDAIAAGKVQGDRPSRPIRMKKVYLVSGKPEE